MAELLTLPSLTADVSKAAYLERMLDNNSASYKYYWFKGILDEVVSGNDAMSFTRLVARMAASTWYPVVFFRLHLGAGDKLSDLVDYLLTNYHLSRDAKEDAIISAVEASVAEDATLARLVADRTHNVPYRIIRPFYEADLRAHINDIQNTTPIHAKYATESAMLSRVTSIQFLAALLRCGKRPGSSLRNRAIHL